MNNINWVSFGLCEISRSDAVEIFTWALSDGAFHRYVLDTWKASPNNLEYVARNRMLFDRLLRDLEKERAYFLSIPGSSLAVICNPTVVSKNISASDASSDEVPQALVEMDVKSNEVLQTLYNSGRTVLHIYLLGRDTASESSRTRKKVNAHELLLRIIRFATTSGWPLYLEATSPRSRDLFKRVGFKIVREIKVGVGQVDGEGVPSDGGEGVSLWVATFDV